MLKQVPTGSRPSKNHTIYILYLWYFLDSLYYYGVLS